MKNIICIGELSLNLVLDANGGTLGAYPGGRIANAAMMLGRENVPVIMASEAATDIPGNIVIERLETAGVDTHCVDRPTEGHTVLNVIRLDNDAITRYEDYAEECFDIIWPKLEENDIVVYGGFYAIDKRMRARMSKFLNYAAERHAIMVCLPGFLPQQEPRITRVMPEILENLEMASLVVTRNSDLSILFNSNSGKDAYKNHVNFYCRSMININTAGNSIEYFTDREASAVGSLNENCSTLLWNAGALAGVLKAIANSNYTHDSFETPSADMRESLLNAATEGGLAAIAGISEPWMLMK